VQHDHGVSLAGLVVVDAVVPGPREFAGAQICRNGHVISN
jgi:hypothetical protein